MLCYQISLPKFPRIKLNPFLTCNLLNKSVSVVHTHVRDDKVEREERVKNIKYPYSSHVPLSGVAEGAVGRGARHPWQFDFKTVVPRVIAANYSTTPLSEHVVCPSDCVCAALLFL